MSCSSLWTMSEQGSAEWWIVQSGWLWSWIWWDLWHLLKVEVHCRIQEKWSPLSWWVDEVQSCWVLWREQTLLSLRRVRRQRSKYRHDILDTHYRWSLLERCKQASHITHWWLKLSWRFLIFQNRISSLHSQSQVEYCQASNLNAWHFCSEYGLTHTQFAETESWNHFHRFSLSFWWNEGDPHPQHTP